MITARTCMLIKVNYHKHNYNGTICSHATRHRCGASENFRQNKCAKDQAFCYDMDLFNPADQRVVKPAEYDRDGYLTDLRDTVMVDKDNPLVFFWSVHPSSGARVLVGMYVVRAVEQSAYYNDFNIQPEARMAIFFDDPELTNEFLYKHSIGYDSFSRSISENYVPTALNEILRRQRNLMEECRRRSDQQSKAKRMEENVGRIEAVITSLGHLPEESHEDLEETGISVSRATSPAIVTGAGQDVAPSVPEKAQPAQLPQIPEAVAPAVQLTQAELVDKMTDVVNSIRSHTRDLGLFYPEELIKRYHLSLETKPFVIFAGVSGGGKTQLAIAYATAQKAQLRVISVGPNWTTNESLLGCYDVLNNRFVPTEFTRFLIAADEDFRKSVMDGRPPTKYCVVLDEMNLSHVEYYFSDFLSKMELPPELRVITLHSYADQEISGTVSIPPNLYITGTVNVDETTHRFSPKVLDRANFIRLDEINLQEMLALIDHWQPAIHNKDQAREVTTYLRGLNTVLAASQQHFGYRTAREIITWVDRATASGAFAMTSALDIQILQKVLVKVQGSKFSPTERAMIQELVVYFEDKTDKETQKLLFPQSTAQIQRMQKELIEDEFTFGQQ